VHSAEILAAAFALMFATSAALKVGAWRSWTAVAGRVVGDGPGSRAASVFVPLVEVGVACLAFALPAPGLAAAAVVLAVFAAVLAVRTSDLAGSECGCFGALLPSRIGPGLVWRNAGLSALAAAGSVLAASEAAVSPGPLDLLIALLALTVGAAVIRRLEPDVQEHGPPTGSIVEIPGVGVGRPAVAVFLLPGCPSCEEAGPALAELDSRHLDLTVIGAIGEGSPAQRERLAGKLGRLARLDLGELRAQWGIVGAPFAVAVDRRGRVVDAGFGASPAALERISHAALTGTVQSRFPSKRRPRRSFANERPLGRTIELGTRRQALATIGGAFAFSMLVSQAAGQKRFAGPTLRLRRRAGGAKPTIYPVPGTCKEYFDFQLPEKVCGVKGSGGCVLFDGFLDHDNSQITSKVVKYKEAVTNKSGTFCPACAVDNPGTCFPTAAECVSNCHGSIGSCSGTCGTHCNEEVCIEAIATQELTPNLHATILKWVPPKGLSKSCSGYVRDVNEQVRTHEVDGHLAQANTNLADKNKRLLENKPFRACAPTVAEARAQIQASMAIKVNEARQAFVEQFLVDGVRFHESFAGRNVKPECDKFCGK
jgi:hypothetical protein